jgi:hypothetical protein
VFAAATLLAGDAWAQAVVEPVLSGRVLLGANPLTSGTVVLHEVSDVTQGEIDSTRVAPDGTFTLRLPGVPSSTLGQLYFASVRHQGVMYFGQALADVAQLDSQYVIQAYDTILAPPEGIDVALESRLIFIEASGATWVVTDVFSLRNDRDRTIVARPEGRVWSYPLPAAATEVQTGEGEMSADVIRYENGGITARAALPPGGREFVVRYTLTTLEVEIPTPGTTGTFDVLVREPAPPLDVMGLTPAASEELPERGTYRRYAADSVSIPSIVIALGEEAGPPPVQWIAVGLALVLAAGGLIALKRTTARPKAVRVDGRQDLLLQLARLDEDFEARRSPSAAAKQEYQQQRADLLHRLKSSG